MLENAWLSHVVAWIWHFNGPLFLARWHFKFLLPNRRMDERSLSLWLMQGYFYTPAPPHVTLEKGTTFSGHSYWWPKISTWAGIPTAFRSIWNDAPRYWSRSHEGQNVFFFSVFSIQAIFTVKAPRRGRGRAEPLVSYIATAWCFSDLTCPERAVRDGPCGDNWPKLWLLSGKGNPFRTNRKRSFSIMYSHREQVNSLLFSSKQWIQDT